METVLKYDRVILVKEMNGRLKKVGEVYEIANVLDEAFLLRDGRTRDAVGVVNFEDFDKCFVKEKEAKGWTSWTPFIGFDGQNDCLYRTNGKKVQVKMVKDKVKSEASCNKNEDEFKLWFGIQIAYRRCQNKALKKKQVELEKQLDAIKSEIAENNNVITKMVESLV